MRLRGVLKTITLYLEMYLLEEKLLYWVTFVGEGRSGHTILSGILGSHPHVRITDEQKYISQWYRQHWTKEKILFQLLISGAGKARAAQGWPRLRDHDDPLLVVGDKCGWDAVNEYAKRGAPSSIISNYGVFMGMPIKTIVTVRNPYDNIATWINSNKYARLFPDRYTRGARMIRRYRRFYNNAWDVLQAVDDYMLIPHERLVESPSVVIQELSDWLTLPKDKAWRRAAAWRIWSKPREQRKTVVYTDDELSKIKHIIDSNLLMEYYRDAS